MGEYTRMSYHNLKIAALAERIARLIVAGNDVTAALIAAMEGDDTFADVEAVEHCNAQIERWVELVDARALLAETSDD